jgi:hypothetical protein
MMLYPELSAVSWRITGASTWIDPGSVGDFVFSRISRQSLGPNQTRIRNEKQGFFLSGGTFNYSISSSVEFDSEWNYRFTQLTYLHISLTQFSRPQYGPGVDSASNRNEYQEYFLTTLPLSCADCLKIWEPQPPGTLRVCQGL